MSRWFRHYAGLCRDEKLVSVAIKAKQPVALVVWVWAAILESAAEVDDGGRYSLDAAEAAYFLRTDEADILAITAALQASGRLDEDRVVKWGNRQFASDRSKERAAAHRERKRAEGVRPNISPLLQDGDVTLPHRHGNAPETETETETETEVDTASAASTAPRHDYAEIERRCRLAAGLENEPSPNLFNLSPIVQLLDKGADLDRDVLPVLRAKAAGPKKARSWNWFVPAIVEAMQPHAAVAKLPPPKTPEDERAAWARMLRSHAGGYWNDHWGPPPGSPGCKIPADFIKAQQERAA